MFLYYEVCFVFVCVVVVWGVVFVVVFCWLYCVDGGVCVVVDEFLVF